MSNRSSNIFVGIFWSVVCGLVSGLLAGLVYVYIHSLLIFFCLVPLFWFWLRSVERPSARTMVFVSGWVTQLTFNVVAFHWLRQSTIAFFDASPMQSVFALLVYSSFDSLFIPVSGIAFVQLAKMTGARFTRAGVLLVFTFVFFQSFWPWILPFNFGYLWLTDSLPGSQLTSVIGSLGLHTVTLFINLALALALTGPHRKLSASAAVALFAFANLFGLFIPNSAPPDRHLKVLLVQANVWNHYDLGKPSKVTFIEYRSQLLATYIELTRKELRTSGPVDFIIWPEGAVLAILDLPPNVEDRVAQDLRTFLSSVHTPLLTGGRSINKERNGIFNALFYLGADGKNAIEPYYKTILVPFAEGNPLFGWQPFTHNGWHVSNPGEGQKLRRLDLQFGADTGSHVVNVGPAICYEALFTRHMGSLAQLGAQIFINVANDGWFHSDLEKRQHALAVRAKALESRRPLIRVTTDGLTEVVNEDGSELASLPMNEPATKVVSLDYRSVPMLTFYDLVASYEPWFYGFMLAAATFIFWRTSRSRRAFR